MATNMRRFDPEPQYTLTGPTYFMGDVHGDYDLVEADLYTRDYTPGNLILLGDIGLGFCFKEVDKTRQFYEFCSRLGNLGWTVYAVRGNHDRPAEWRCAPNSVKVEGFPRLLKDNTTITINDHLFYVTGGGVSLDRHFRSPGKSWWEDEPMYMPPEAVKELKGKVYGVLSHVGPLPAGMAPLATSDAGLEQDLEREMVQVRRILKMKPRKWFYGHYHRDDFRLVDDTDCICLGIRSLYPFLDYGM